MGKPHPVLQSGSSLHFSGPACWRQIGVSPGVSSQLLPQGLNALVLVLLFASTMLDWIVQAFRSKLRPGLSDAFVFLLIAALPPVAYAASHFARPVCQDSFQ